MTKTVQGPAWTAAGLDLHAGRYPLSVERHVMRMADHLVAGVTTVTPHARYYCVHALVATEVEARDLTIPAAQDLLRRAEVALAAVSWAHAHGEVGLLSAITESGSGAHLVIEIDPGAAAGLMPGGRVFGAGGSWRVHTSGV